MKQVKKHQSLIPVYATFYRSIMTLNGTIPLLAFQRTESRGQVIFLMLEWHKNSDHLC